MSEQNRKTLRSFYCRDYLWELFEVMTRDLGCSMDYLINEAMRHYARSRNYSLTGSAGPNVSQPGLSSSELPPSQVAPVLRAPEGPPSMGRAGFEHRTFERMPAATRNPYPPPRTPAPPARFQVPPAAPPPPPMIKPPPPMAAPAPPPAPAAPPLAAPPAAQPGRRQLYVIFNDQRYPVSKDKFIIGRASQLTDLTIRDGNVSRKHCVIIYRGGQYYIKDLDSTNGLEYKGSRIDSKKIEEGDQINICEYELRFTFR
ncbi:MAG: FHA domain-containing protein [Myxococcota bacterium]|jgi:hypothetical protein|nr:FHA domain-containing protein [Myxococcota bacterium]